jgi:ATP adenylyltransferase
MDRLWAPWRMAYIERGSSDKNATDSKNTGCIFCDKPKSGNPSEEFLIAKGKYVFVLMNIYPYTNGHLMVAPYEHTSHYELLPTEVTSEMTQYVQESIKALTVAFHPHGFNVGMNLGEAAGAGIAQHLHMHIVPRWTGDANFMPVIGDVRVMPDSLESTYAKVMAAWRQ